MKKLGIMVVLLSLTSSAFAGHTFLDEKRIICKGQSDEYQNLRVGFKTTDPFNRQGTQPELGDWFAVFESDGEVFHAGFRSPYYKQTRETMDSPLIGTYTAAFSDLEHGKLLQALHADCGKLESLPVITIVEEVDRDGDSTFKEAHFAVTIKEKHQKKRTIEVPLVCSIHLLTPHTEDEEPGVWPDGN